MTSLSAIATPTTAALHHVRFLAAAPAGVPAVMEFRDPYRCVAICEALPARSLPTPGEGSPDSFHVLFVPSGSATPYEEQQRAERWMAKPETLIAEPTIELVLRSDRILWRAGRALVHGAPERFAETLAGLIDFAFHEGELRKLESELDRDWPTYEADIPLTHQVADADLARREHVNRMTAEATRRRMFYARLERRLDKADIALPGPARRLVSELLVQSEVLDRMKSVDDRIEVYEDLYELANDRLSEYQYFRTEYRIEAWIFLVLALELVFVVWEVVLVFQEN